MPSASYIVVGTTNGSASSYSGSVAPIGSGMTPGSLYISIDNGLGGYNGIGFGAADDGSGNIDIGDGDGLSDNQFATGDGSTTIFTFPLDFGFLEPTTVSISVNGTEVAADDGSGNLVFSGGSTTETFPGFGAGHTYHHTIGNTPVTPGTVTCGISPSSTGVWADDGAGNLVGSGITAGTIDYATGVCTWTDAASRTSQNLKIAYSYGLTGSGTVYYTPGYATVTFGTAPTSGAVLQYSVSAYGVIGTIDYSTGAYTFRMANQAGPIVGASGFNLYFSYQYAQNLPPPIPGAPGLSLTPVVPPTLAALLQALGNSYGVDVMCLTDLDPNFSLVQNALAQDVYHLVTEQPGSIFWSPIQTFSLRSMLSRGIVSASLAATAAAIQSVIASDERVSQAQCTITQTGPETVEVTIQVFPEQGTAFQLVAAVGKVSITLISVGLVNL